MRFIFTFFLLIPFFAYPWGFFAHQKINRLAVFTLPPEMIGFYKKHLEYVTDHAVSADKRRYAIKEEACRHYIDLDVYGDSARYKVPKYWKQAVEKYSEDTLKAYGIVPWHINFIKFQLTEAFKEGDVNKILKLSADIGHYIGDANVPLHTTQNYNGQLTGQHGIHGFWESRLPELFFTEYNFFTGPAYYMEDVQEAAWNAVYRSSAALDSILSFEKTLNEKFSEARKYSFEERGGANVKVYSQDYSKAYHKMLNGQIERQMRASIKMVGDVWYTCWVDAGQPDLNSLTEEVKEKETISGEGEKCDH